MNNKYKKLSILIIFCFKVTGFLSVSQSVPKDLANCRTDIVYILALRRSRESLN